MEIKYHYRSSVPPTGRYSIACQDLNDEISTLRPAAPDDDVSSEDPTPRGPVAASLTRLINQEQAFSVVPAMPDVVYSHSHFYCPDLDKSVLSMVEPSEASVGLIS